LPLDFSRLHLDNSAHADDGALSRAGTLSSMQRDQPQVASSAARKAPELPALAQTAPSELGGSRGASRQSRAGSKAGAVGPSVYDDSTQLRLIWNMQIQEKLEQRVSEFEADAEMLSEVQKANLVALAREKEEREKRRVARMEVEDYNKRQSKLRRKLQERERSYVMQDDQGAQPGPLTFNVPPSSPLPTHANTHTRHARARARTHKTREGAHTHTHTQPLTNYYPRAQRVPLSLQYVRPNSSLCLCAHARGTLM
jgi:hypothetical protein